MGPVDRGGLGIGREKGKGGEEREGKKPGRRETTKQLKPRDTKTWRAKKKGARTSKTINESWGREG